MKNHRQRDERKHERHRSLLWIISLFYWLLRYFSHQLIPDVTQSVRATWRQLRRVLTIRYLSSSPSLWPHSLLFSVEARIKSENQFFSNVNLDFLERLFLFVSICRLAIFTPAATKYSNSSIICTQRCARYSIICSLPLHAHIWNRSRFTHTHTIICAKKNVY